jgi:prephenate dehydratase
MFYVDVDIARDSLAYGRAVTQLGEFAQWVRTLGSYRAWA